MTAENVKNVRCVRLYLVGPPCVGKSTFLGRLQYDFDNINTKGDEAKYESTLLANCTQILSIVSRNAVEWRCSKNLKDDTGLLIGYLNGVQHSDSPSTRKSVGSEIQQPAAKKIEMSSNDDQPISSVSINPSEDVGGMVQIEPTPAKRKVNEIRKEFESIVPSGSYDVMYDMFEDATLVNVCDVGGQPGFLEMLPALSSGPGMYMVFLNLNKKLDELYEIPFCRGNEKIEPFVSSHTVESTISQILSSIATFHNVTQDSSVQTLQALNPEFKEKFEAYRQIKPTATLIGTHKDKLESPVEEKVEQLRQTLSNITQPFNTFLTSPSFFAVDNLNGTEETDMGDLRTFLSNVFCMQFEDSSLPVKPQWLLLGMLLRLKYSIVPMEDCYELGEMFSIDKSEVIYCLTYLHKCVGTLMYYPGIGDKWFDNNVICSVQVVFDSISQFILTSLRTLHSKPGVIQEEKIDWVKKGQFSLKTIKKYCAECAKSKVEKNELIPAKQLVHLLKYLRLISPLVHSETENDDTIYFMAAVLECASQDELTNSPRPDANNPQPVHITFSFDAVPTGVFCGLITALVSRGPHKILGMTWMLVEEGVKRNLVSFCVKYVHKVTLLSHARSYEIRVERNPDQSDFSLHDLCSHVLSVVLYLLNDLYPKLNLSISFQCPCSKHMTNKDLCRVIEDNGKMIFLCGTNSVDPSEHQQSWLKQVRICTVC